MDIFDGSLLNYVIPIIMIILFSLPDAMRKKRRYPKRQTPPAETPQPPAPAKNEPEPARTAPRRVPIRSRKVKAPAEEPAAAVPAAAAQLAAYAASLPPQPKSAAPVRLAKTKTEPWSGLTPEARDLYAGLVWEELLQPPLARRRNRR